jgi:signal transduction histidine kinase
MVESFEQRSGVCVSLYMSDSLGRFRDEIEIAIFRVTEECLANVLRHSGSAEARVSLSMKDAWLRLSVSDSGTTHAGPLLIHSYNSRSGVGISGMRERVEQLGGCLSIDCTSAGTSVTAAIPLETGA